MQELEKILEEIEAERADIDESPSMKDRMLDRHWNNCLDAVADIIKKHMNDDWIPVVRGLPELDGDELSEDVLISFSDSYNICIGFYDFNEKRWYVHGSGPCIGRVVAWSPLPEPYRPERSVH